MNDTLLVRKHTCNWKGVNTATVAKLHHWILLPMNLQIMSLSGLCFGSLKLCPRCIYVIGLPKLRISLYGIFLG